MPPGVDMVALSPEVTEEFTSGTVHFDDVTGPSTGLMKISWTQNLPALFGVTDTDLDGDIDVADVWATLISAIVNPLELIEDVVARGNLGELTDSIFNAITGDTGIGVLLTDLIDALKAIPSGNVGGVGGPENLVDTIQETWDQLIGGFVGAVGGGTGLADLFNIGQDISSRASLGKFSWDILGIRSNKSLNTGLLSTSESNFSLDKVALQSSAPTFAVTQSTAITAFQRISESASKGAVSWLGSGVTNVTHCFVNIYKMDTATGDMALVHGSANVVGLLSSSMQYNIYELPDPIQVEPGEVYGIEIAIRGAGTHDVVGSSTWLRARADSDVDVVVRGAGLVHRVQVAGHVGVRADHQTCLPGTGVEQVE